MVLHKLNTGVEIRRVEFIRNIPSQGPELPAFLYDGVHEGDAVQHGLPLGHVGHIEEILAKSRIRPLQSGLDALGRLIGEFDSYLLTDIGEM